MLLRNPFAWKPDAQWLLSAEYETRRTPDVVELSLSEYRLLFVVDDMKVDFEKYKEIAEYSAPVTRAFTQSPFQFFCRTIGEEKTYIPLEKPEDSLRAVSCKISGELHAVKSTHLFKLDILKDNGVQFIRKRIKVLVPSREMPMAEYRELQGKRLPPALLGKKGVLSPERVDIKDAFMYVGNPEYWNVLIDQPYFAGGKSFEPVWVSTAFKEKRWLRKYYNLVQPYEKPKRNNR